MTNTPKWLPDGSGIDPDSLDDETPVETRDGIMRFTDGGGFRLSRKHVGNTNEPPMRWAARRIVRVYADVTPPRPDPRVEVVARVMASRCGSDVWEAWAKDARIALAALDAMGDEK